MVVQDTYSNLRALLLANSVRFGHFVLASGKESDIYVDGKLTTCRPEAMPLIGKIFLEKISKRGWHPKAVGGLTVGADPIAFAIARESLNEPKWINAFIVRKEPKKHGMQRYIEGIEETHGLPVVVIDDVCSTGDSTAKAIVKAKQAGMIVLGAVCLVDRDMGASELLQSEHGCTLDHIFTLDDLRDGANEFRRAPEHAGSTV